MFYCQPAAAARHNSATWHIWQYEKCPKSPAPAKRTVASKPTGHSHYCLFSSGMSSIRLCFVVLKSPMSCSVANCSPASPAGQPAQFATGHPNGNLKETTRGLTKRGLHWEVVYGEQMPALNSAPIELRFQKDIISSGGPTTSASSTKKSFH